MFRSSFILMIFVIIQVQDALGQFGTPLLVRSADVVLHDHHAHEDHDPHARLAALDHFLGTYVHHNHALDILQQAGDNPNGCGPNNKFTVCCVQIGMTSLITNIPDLINAACKYPPDELGMKQKITLGYYFNEYVMCYADGRNNKDCCAQAGVPTEVKYGMWTTNCQGICNGNKPGLTANPGWEKCIPFKPQVAKCNEGAFTLGDDTAAVRHGFCKNPIAPWCQTPMVWKTMCRPKVGVHTYLDQYFGR
uniref:Secreted protein n=1 Tax=Globodera rostochiensis TaxID=31243 RepID=A0A914HMW0_GLORO